MLQAAKQIKSIGMQASIDTAVNAREAETHKADAMYKIEKLREIQAAAELADLARFILEGLAPGQRAETVKGLL